MGDGVMHCKATYGLLQHLHLKFALLDGFVLESSPSHKIVQLKNKRLNSFSLVLLSYGWTEIARFAIKLSWLLLKLSLAAVKVFSEILASSKNSAPVVLVEWWSCLIIVTLPNILLTAIVMFGGLKMRIISSKIVGAVELWYTRILGAVSMK